MKRILSERNLVAILFVLVMVAFSFAHEDSKKRDVLYNASAIKAPAEITNVRTPSPATVPDTQPEKH